MSTTGGWLNEPRLAAQWTIMQLSKGQHPSTTMWKDLQDEVKEQGRDHDAQRFVCTL